MDMLEEINYKINLLGYRTIGFTVINMIYYIVIACLLKIPKKEFEFENFTKSHCM